MAVAVALPIADRRVAHDFYRAAFGLETVGELADDGLPEPLQFVLGPGAVLVLVPRGGFGWVAAGNDVAEAGHSECILSHLVPSAADVDRVTEAARAAGATVRVEPGDPGWGYSSTVADPDGHLWMIRVDPSG
ncbi:VOC family protein [Actinomycetospora lutea]|uniref:VOC family protein n=1 Tax=Actinomycetospora lutea TaxID=663604 RepID=UPI0023651302|nr:VOC family protein [Actinomycetospora lutea]MDD7939817.1 VOC family protein [Actinomycetospora lutea]